MDFGKAALLIAVVFGLVEFGKRFLGPKLSSDSRIVAALAIVVGQLGVWLMAETAWAHEQVVGSKPLDELNTGSKILVGLFVAGGAAFGAEFLGSLKNMGQNQMTPIQRKALDAGAERLVDAQLTADMGGSHPAEAKPEDFNFGEKPTLP
jgi:hypothetical protein